MANYLSLVSLSLGRGTQSVTELIGKVRRVVVDQ